MGDKRIIEYFSQKLWKKGYIEHVNVVVNVNTKMDLNSIKACERDSCGSEYGLEANFCEGDDELSRFINDLECID